MVPKPNHNLYDKMVRMVLSSLLCATLGLLQAAATAQLARSEEQLVMKGRLRQLEDDLAAAVAATVQEKAQTLMKARRSEQQAKVGEHAGTGVLLSTRGNGGSSLWLL